MKLDFHSCFLIFLIVFLLLTSPYVSSRLLTPKQGQEEELEIKRVKDGDLSLTTESHDSFDWLMGLEECENGDKECFNRRVLAEAHLDYIYTQKHKP